MHISDMQWNEMRIFSFSQDSETEIKQSWSSLVAFSASMVSNNHITSDLQSEKKCKLLFRLKSPKLHLPPSSAHSLSSNGPLKRRPLKPCQGPSLLWIKLEINPCQYPAEMHRSWISFVNHLKSVPLRQTLNVTVDLTAFDNKPARVSGSHLVPWSRRPS